MLRRDAGVSGWCFDVGIQCDTCGDTCARSVLGIIAKFSDLHLDGIDLGTIHQQLEWKSFMQTTATDDVCVSTNELYSFVGIFKVSRLSKQPTVRVFSGARSSNGTPWIAPSVAGRAGQLHVIISFDFNVLIIAVGTHKVQPPPDGLC